MNNRIRLLGVRVGGLVTEAQAEQAKAEQAKAELAQQGAVAEPFQLPLHF